MREAILAEINFLTTKIESIKDLALKKERERQIEKTWPEVVKGSKKVLAIGQPIPVLSNRFQPLCNLSDNRHEGSWLKHKQKKWEVW